MANSISFSLASQRTPTYVYASVFASLSIIIGLIWDISWHTSIGRDGLFSPPHLAIYLGAVIAGVFSGFKVLKISFAGTDLEKASTVRFWGIFRGSLGALFCIWGAFAMLTSAPFDDWWHNTYGLDVEILSPPHTVLALGIMMIQFGAVISTLSQQNQMREDQVDSIRKLLFMITSGLLLVSLFTISSEFLERHDMHHSSFYQVAGLVFPVYLVAIGKASKLKWAATITAFVYSITMALFVWILPLFPAEPLLGPIRNHITHYQSFHFPILLVFPAILIDYLLFRGVSWNKWLLSVALGTGFVLVLLTVQWPFGDFLMSPYARNWFFGVESWYFGNTPDWEYRYAFLPWHSHSGFNLVKGVSIAIGIAILSVRLGLVWGKWMTKVKR
ncbi:MAG: hypothetical protein KI790_18175 [Cyclobacteriaceae bacterium]|nr:hypothetical protein [Cyclobacteriaceae bacterium HetDA_MAG_MS6]